MRLAWATDIHLDFLADDDVRRFADEIAATGADGLIVSGDLSNASAIVHHLRLLGERFARPLWFVLGNHDYYGGGIADVRAAVRRLCLGHRSIRWLPDAGVVPLTADAAMIGVDGWADARLGAPAHTPVVLNDFVQIADLVAELDPTARARPRLLVGADRSRLHACLRALADAEAAACRVLLVDALARFAHVVVATHVPPFAEACWHEGRLSDDDWLPYFTCAAVGDVLRELAAAAPERRITVLCGHTHGEGVAQILPNLQVLTGGAEYRRPALQRVLTVD